MIFFMFVTIFYSSWHVGGKNSDLGVVLWFLLKTIAEEGEH
jgi:hypothetical protein